MSVSFDTLQCYTLNLIQASIGAISDNFRAISISTNIDKPLIKFHLMVHNSEDLEEIEEILVEFEALQTRPIEVLKEIIFGNELINIDQSKEIVIFRRRE
jgi:hypothetical protein